MDRKLAEKQLETLAPSRAKTRAPATPQHLSAGLADPQHLSFEAVGALQRLAGNAAVAELLAPSAAGAEKDEKQKKSGIGEQAAAAASESSASTLGPLEQVLGPAPAESPGQLGGVMAGIGGAVGESIGAAGGMLGQLGGAVVPSAGLGGAGQKAGQVGGFVGSAIGGMIGGAGAGVGSGIGGVLASIPGLGSMVGAQAAKPVRRARRARPVRRARPSRAAHPNAPVHEATAPTVAVKPPSHEIKAPTAAPKPPEHEVKAPTVADEGPEEAKGPGAAGASGGATAADGGFDPAAVPPHGETVPKIPEPADTKVTTIGQIGQRPAAQPPPRVGAIGAPPAPDHGDLAKSAEGIDRPVHGGGGVLDFIVQAGMSLLQTIIGAVSGNARSTAGEVGSKVGTTSGQITQTAGGEAETVKGEAESAAAGATTQATDHVGAAHAQAHDAVQQSVSQAKSIPSMIAGMLGPLMQAVLAGGSAIPTLMNPFGSLLGQAFQALPGLLTGALTTAESAVNRVMETAAAVVTGASKRLSQVIASTAGVVEGAIDWITGQATALRTAAREKMAGLPSIVRGALSGIVDGVLASVEGAAQAMAAGARFAIQTAVAGAQHWVQTVASMVVTVIDGARKAVDFLLSGLRTMIAAAIAEVRAIYSWLMAKITAMISRAVRAILMPLYERAYAKLMQLIGPEIQQAIERAQLMFPNGLPAPPEVLAAAADAAQQSSAGVLDRIKKGFLNPEGDHFSVGFTVGPKFAAIGGVQFAAGAQLDVVMDYRRNDIGFFASPMGSAQVTVGDVGAAGALTGVAGWGTVSDFGDPKDDVLKAYGGWFENVSVGAQGELADVAGVGMSTGDQFYRSSGGDLDLLFAQVPGPPITIPGTPGQPGTHPLGQVLFHTQKSDADSAPGGPAVMDAATRGVHGLQKQQATVVKGVRVAGEASRIWERPRAGSNRQEENKILSQERADSVKAGLQTRLGDKPPVEATGTGDVRAALTGASPTDNRAEFRRATIIADVETGGTPDRTEPGPSHSQLDVPGFGKRFAGKRSAFGWDTTVGVGALAGGKADLGLYGGGGMSYSIPLGKTHLSAASMEAVREAFFIVKILADVMTLSPLGLIRDVVAGARVDVATDAQAMMANQVTQWSVPMPAGMAAA